MKKLFIVRIWIIANNADEAIRLAKKKTPDEAWISDHWMDKVVFFEQERKETRGFGK